MPISLSLEAVLELAEAAAWYETHRRGLATRFLQEIDYTQHTIQSQPLSFPKLTTTSIDLGIRRALLPRLLAQTLSMQIRRGVQQEAVPDVTSASSRHHLNHQHISVSVQQKVINKKTNALVLFYVTRCRIAKRAPIP